ncbi:MAG TPA: transcription-repair coupling factor [Gemmatimonadales bacterium]|jgi:transcription-repair coupling factor (superfamily II helicase)
MLPALLDAITNSTPFRALVRALPGRGVQRDVTGLVGSSGAVVVAGLARALPERIFVIVTASPAHAERWHGDLLALMDGGVRLYPQREALGEEEPHFEIAGERAETVAAIASGGVRVVVTTQRALAERSRMSSAVLTQQLRVRPGDHRALSHLVTRLDGMGYARTPSVTDVGQFAVRGGIVDVYGFGMADPTRIEWWGDDITSVRAFDLDSQRSAGEFDDVTILPVRLVDGAAEPAEPERHTLLELFPPDAVVWREADVEEADLRRLWDEAERHVLLARRRGEDVESREAIVSAPDRCERQQAAFPRIRVGMSDTAIDFGLSAPPAVARRIAELTRLADTVPTIVLCDNEGQLERLEELLGGDVGAGRLPSGLTLALGSLSGGYRAPSLLVLTDHEIFMRARRLRRPRRYRQALRAAGVGALKAGDYVVHLDHGIGVYRGVETITVGEGLTLEVAVLEYEGGDRLNVPMYRLDQLEPYRTGDAIEDVAPPRLHRLGGTRWQRQRRRTETAIRQLAAELLDLYARRAVAPGFACPPDTRWQRELESSFLYDDTPDQRLASEEAKRDMERPHPMDRLIVGDVGYGKTEVAVRAAFKSVQAGGQVAVLVPTTILAEQHARTFRERLADYPVRVEVLSRFRNPAEQRAVIEAVARGAVDIVIGTHRLLSKDVTFHQLGLLIVDEEHRFGVRHKERLKELRLQVDVLTLTATPIPRTLHQALFGLRDLTLIETPPRDRSPVLTFIEPWDDALIEESIARELDRGGQVYVVHNRIETIESIAERVRRLAPRARIAVAHGRMRERDLDAVMRAFVAGATDILVATMIVESGLDVTNANTMIVHNAHHVGLAQLYQLRGRVGRGHRRAYCYLLVPDVIDDEAEERLKVLEHHTELGSGYRIALRDLQLRGAGNLLGAEQSGHAHAVGIDLYLRWLADAVRALRDTGAAVDRPLADVVMDGSAYLPDAFIPDEDAKLDVYRRLARVVTRDEIAALRAELRDRFGGLPAEAEGLLLVSELRLLGSAVGLEAIAIHGDAARIRFRAGAAPRLLRLNAALDEVQFAAEVRQTVPLSLRLRRLGGLSTGAGLVRALATVLEDEKA